MMVGAAIDDPDSITAIATMMAPTLAGMMQLSDLDAVYTRWLTTALQDPERKAVMVTAHDLLSTWSALQAELSANQASEHERRAREYKAQVQAELRANPRKVRRVDEWAAQDGVTLPWRTPQNARSEAEKPQESRQDYDRLYPTQELTEAELEEQRAKELRNREAWYRMASEAERLASKTEQERTTNDGKADKERGRRSGADTPGR